MAVCVARLRAMALGKKDRDVIAEINRRGVYCHPAQYSNAVHGHTTTPKDMIVLDLADKILTEWELAAKNSKNKA